MSKGSAKHGHVYYDDLPLCPVTVFETEDSVELHAQVDNTTGGKKARIVGNEEFSATITQIDRTPSLTEGSSYTLIFDNGHIMQTEYVRVERRRQNVDINAGGPVVWNYDVVGDVEDEPCPWSSSSG